MQYINHLIRFFLGSLFLIAGLNKVFEFMKPMEFSGGAQKMVSVIMQSGYLWETIAAVEIIGGMLLISSYFVPLGLAVLAPVVLNIVLFHLYLDANGLILSFVLAFFEGYLIYIYREKFAVFFIAR